jgi:hypothetical protein
MSLDTATIDPAAFEASGAGLLEQLFLAIFLALTLDKFFIIK